MSRTLAAVAAVFALSAAPVFAAPNAGPYTLDAHGKCHDAHGKFAKHALCEHRAYWMDAAGRCRNGHGQYAPASMCANLRPDPGH